MTSRAAIILTIAWRNLWRHPGRTLLTAATAAFGLALLLATLGLGDGTHRQMIESAVGMGSGHVLIESRGYRELGGIERVLTARQVERARRWLEARRPAFSIRHLLERVFASGLASSAEGAAGVYLIGLDPAAEKGVSRFGEKIVRGEFLSSSDPERVVLGRGVARKLGLGIGDKLVLMGQAAGSREIESRLFRVAGILETGEEELDEVLLLTTLDTARSFFHLDGGSHELAVILSHPSRSGALARMAAQALPQLEVLSWREALAELDDFIRIDDAGSYLFNTLVFVLIAFMVLNTLLMSVLERRREFSLLEALGLAGGERFLMVLVEGLFIALLACGAGLALGLAVHAYLAVYGIPLDLFASGEFTAAGVALDPVIYSSLGPARIFQALSWVLLMTLLLSLLPAWRAARRGSVALLGSG